MNTISEIEQLREKQLAFFNTGITREVAFRKDALKKLRAAIIANEPDIKTALKKDLNKSSFEVYATEIGIVLAEISTQIRHLAKWAKPKRVKTPLFAFPSASYIYPEPYGRVLVISPWNYPFQLPMVPLVGAIAAGNVAVIRQSRNSPATNEVIKRILSSSLAEEHAAVIECDIQTAEEALRHRWDLIFFTGSTQVGRKIYSDAARHLTPVVLELGGKSPVIVDSDANIPIAARRIVWGKNINAGQTCISPDYVLVHEDVKQALVDAVISEIRSMYGDDPVKNPDYPRVINEKAFDRLCCFIRENKVLAGGNSDRQTLVIEPTVIEPVEGSSVMTEEIFGPVLPVRTFRSLDEAISNVRAGEKPLAIYYFSENRLNQKRLMKETSSGAFLVNDLILHIANKNLPFGGVGESGLGRYHGKESFRSFSNLKAVMKTSTIIDIPIKYPPFGKKERLIKWFLK
ncbi:MAG: aldehyde dehydrogenase [Bacteroidales bacterium]